MFNSGYEVPVNIWTKNGSYHRKWTKDATTLALTQLTIPTLPKIITPPSQILDVSNSGNVLAIASEFEIEILDTSTLKGIVTVSLPKQENLDPKITRISNRKDMNVIQNSTNKLYYFLPTLNSTQNLNIQLQDFGYLYQNLSDLDWGVDNNTNTLWRIDQNGKLWKCNIFAW